MTSPHPSSLRLVSDDAPRKAHTESVLTEVPRRSVSRSLLSPHELRQRFALTPRAAQQIASARARINSRIQEGTGAPIAIVGPCSIHCENAAIEYAERLSALQRVLGDRVQLVMRVYLEKPRTTIGWKGFLYDPDLSGESDLAAGLARGRALMVRISELGMPIATEILDPLAADYFEDCLSWVAIGARTAESQIHRQLASGLECAVGFKNGTDGGVTVATQAMEAAGEPHAHLGIDREGRIAMKHTEGNRATHVVLRGGHSGPNYQRDAVSRAAENLRACGKGAAVLVDCSHGNSEKDYRRQPAVARAVIAQMNQAHADVFGLMLESHLVAGKQAPEGPREYGMSVTDGCIDFLATEAILLEMASVGSDR